MSSLPAPFVSRLIQLIQLLDERSCAGMAVSHLPNIRYLSGFTGSNAVLLISPKGAILYTDPRYDIQAREECDCEVRVVKGPLWPELVKDVKKRRLADLGIESAQLPHSEAVALAGALGKSVRLLDVSGCVESLRAIKSADEIEAIRESVNVNSRAFQKTLKKIRPGVSEHEIAAELEYQMKRSGAENVAFETIVAAGGRSALPHARPTSARVAASDMVLVDMGALVNGYCSDMTRCVHLGTPPAKTKRMYAAVLEAQLAAIDAVKPGATAAQVDAAARKSLKARRMDEYFTHSTGHGLGLEIHESPKLGAKVKDALAPGMVITIEPGVYLEGVGGVRIEDTVLVTDRGVEVLTPTSKELLVLES